MAPAEYAGAGWVGSAEDFAHCSEQQWLGSLQRYHQRSLLEPASPEQLVAWQNCFRFIRPSLTQHLQSNPEAAEWTFIFEYELPRERGRRPDLVILNGGSVQVVEFKDFSQPRQSHLDQVSAYARDLAHYHSASHRRPVNPILVPTGFRDVYQAIDECIVTGPDQLWEVADLRTDRSLSPLDAETWVTADYAPLPSLVAAARTIFKNEPLPQIRRAQSAGIEQTIQSLIAISDTALATNSLHLALVTGVPGAGKTLVGLQFVYTHRAEDPEENKSAVFLSGNGPLVKVLQHALKSSVFVQDVHGFLRQYGGNSVRTPKEHIWVYDEAQRAWDADRVQEKRGHSASEPEDFLRLGRRMDSWAVVVGLIGEGQEIHLGEESGLKQWNDAIQSVGGSWTVHCPEHVQSLFTAADHVTVDNSLNLTQSLRSHLASDVQTWIRLLLDGELNKAATVAESMRKQGFDLYLTRDLDVASAYVRERYEGELDKRYGLIASSKAKNVSKWGVQNSFEYTRRFKDGPWYNDPPDSRFSCCQLHDVATEFQCQGLELDFPILAWGDDLSWDSSRWISPEQRRSKARNPHQLRVNSYRVLLSRGRDGLIVFVPPDTLSDATVQAISSAGARILTIS